MQTLQSLPGMRWMIRHPRLTAWVVLAVGMLLFLFIEARDIGLTGTNWIALIVATVLVAGLCVWIVSWEDNNEVDAAVIAEAPAETVAPPLIDPASETEVASTPIADNPDMPR